jgi:precorrin-6B methylase 1
MRLPDGSKLETISGGEGIAILQHGDSMYYEAEYI